MKLVLIAAAAASLAACTDASPMSRSMVDVWVHADPTVTPPIVYVELGVIDHLDSFADAVSAGEITATLDDRPLVLDPQTGFTQHGGDYTAYFDLPAIAAQTPASRETPTLATPRARETPGSNLPPTQSRIVITDGITTWHAQFTGLFTNDLAPVAPLVAGENTFVWPSAKLTNDGVPEIQSACLEVVGHSSHCTSYGDRNPDRISQQYVTLPNDASSGDPIVVTAERWDDAPDSGASQFIARIKNRYATTQP